MPQKEDIFSALLQIVSINTVDLSSIELNWKDNLVIEAFANQAERSGVAAWCFYILLQNSENKKRYPELLARLKKSYLAVLVDNQQKLVLFREIEKILASHNIPMALLKGMAMAFTVYPEEALRPMSDLDILVPKNLIFKVRDILLGSGCKSTHIPMSEWHEKNNAHIRGLRFPPHKYLIEIHSKLYASGSRLQPKNMQWNTSVIEHNTSFGSFTTLNFHLMIYHLASHLYYGYMMGGIRLGWMIDIAMVFDKASNAELLMQKVLKVNPSFNKEIIIAIGWSSRFMSQQKRRQLAKWQLLFAPFPDIKLFFEQHKAKARHRLILLNNIWHLPGILNKIKGIWYQVFPSPEYMSHYFKANTKKELFYSYLKRIKNRNN